MKLLLVFVLFVLSPFFSMSNVLAQEEIIASIGEPTAVNVTTFNVQVKEARKGHVVYVDNKQAIWFTANTSDMTTKERAELVAEKLSKILSAGIDASIIKPVREGAYTYIQAGDEKIVTVDEANAKSVGVSVHELAYTWANNTRIALGETPLRKDYSDVSRGFNGQESRYIGQKTEGIASWYGGYFHGRRSSDGSRFNTDEYTAAHKTYPFGTLVKVTNLRTSKSCVVKITDRGPYVEGRIIDLSKKAAEDIGMLGSGIAKVRLEVVGQY